MTRIQRSRVSGVLAACFGLLLLAGCEDPSGVGLTVIDFGDTDPRARTVPAEAEMDSVTSFTGFIRPATGAFTQRFIAGRADDPIFGSIETIGYIDFMHASLPVDFFVATIDEVFLDFIPTYVFGDTTRPLEIDLYEVDGPWSPDLFTADSTLNTLPELVTSFSVAPADTLVRVRMPDKWVAERDSVLRSPQFDGLFNGFELRPQPHSGMAVGFQGESAMRVVYRLDDEAAPDTTTFISFGIATSGKLEPNTGSPPSELLPLQDNTGIGVRLEFRVDTLDSRAISAGIIRLEADTMLVQAGRSSSFVRPIAQSLVLYGINGGAPSAITDATFDPESQSYIFAGPLVNILLQELALDRSPFDSIVVGFPRGPRTLNVAPLIVTPERHPRVVVLVVPTG